MRFIRLLAVGFLLSALAACGGGGGGGGGTGGDGLTVGASSLTFSMPSGGTPPAPQNVAVTVTNPAAVYAGAAYTTGNTPAAWLSVQVLGVAPNYTFQFSANPAGLSVGTYTTSIAVGITTADGTVLGHRDVGVTLNVGASLKIQPAPLAFSYALGAPAPAAQAVTVSANGTVSWTATADQPWVTLSATSGTTPTSTLNVGVKPDGLAPGNYTATLTISGGGDSITAAIAFTVSAPATVLSQSLLTFSGVNGTTLDTTTLKVELNNGAAAPWTATSSDPWVVLSQSSGTTPQVLTISANPAIGSLASGVHNATITLGVTYGSVTLNSVVPVTLTLSPATLLVTVPSIQIGGADGSDTTAVTAQLSLNTGANAFPWTVSGLSGAAHLAPISGALSSSPVTLTFQPATNMVGDTYTSTAVFSATVNGDVVTRSVPVTVLVEPHRLFVHESGVAFTSTPSLSVTTRSITVRENRGIPVTWTATSDQPWLTLTNSTGSTPGTLQLTADPGTLPSEAISYANVTVASADPSVSGTEVIRVGLYKTANAPGAQTTATLPAVQKAVGIVADPVRPFVYVTHGTTVVEAYNIYTGALQNTITATAGSDLRSLAISDDGNRLYVVDAGTLSIRSADTSTSATTFNANWTDGLPCTACITPFTTIDLDYTRVNGRGIVVGGGYEYFDASTGTLLINSGGMSMFASSWAASVSGDGSKLFAAGLFSSGHPVTRQTLAFDELHTLLNVGTRLTVQKDGASRGVSTDYTGSVVYRACWFQDQTIERFDGTNLANLSTITSGTNGGVILGPGGYGYCARYYDDFGPGWPDLWAVDPSTGAVIAGHQYNVTDTVMERQYVISGDGLRLITRSQATASPTTATLTSTTIAP